MKKTTIIIGVCLTTFAMNTYATDVVRATMKKMGFFLEKDIILIPAAKIVAPNDLNSVWKTQQTSPTPNNGQAIYSERAEELLLLDKTVQGNYQYNANDTDPDSPVLRKSINEIHLAYSGVPVPSADVSKQYGFAACNSFHHGWTGFVEFFQNKDLGNCAYTENNFALAQAAAKVDETIVRDDINSKVTTIHVEGNNDSGFVYTVAWMDFNFFRTLECASTGYSDDTTAQVIALARRIDNA